VKKLINLDISRTYQNKELFQFPKIKEMLSSILFVWSKENSDTSYRQGMNEILAILLLGIFPFYFKSEEEENSKEIDFETDSASTLSSQLYFFLYDEKYLTADLFAIFDKLMKRGLKEIYSSQNDDPNINSDSPFTEIERKQKDLFDVKYNEDMSLKTEVILKEKVSGI
jgi:hypothetical protein